MSSLFKITIGHFHHGICSIWIHPRALFVPVPFYLFSMGYAIDVANPIREYDRVDVTLYAVCYHPCHCCDPVRDLSKTKNKIDIFEQNVEGTRDLRCPTVHAATGYAFAG